MAVTIINQGDHPALALKATLRFPNARVDIEEPPRSDREGEWYWTVDRLDGAESEVLHALVTLAERPPGGAFLAQVNVSGAGVQALEDTGGAIVIDRHSPAQARVLDGDHTIVHMDHGQVEVRAPAKVAITFARPASEDHPGSRGEPELPSIAGFKSGLETVVIEATDSDGRTVGQFDSPGTLVHRYTLEQLKALGIEENDLALFRYDDKEREWIPLSTHVDTSAQTATAEIPSGGPYQLSDGSSPSEAFIPSLRGWQVAMSMGTVVFHYPIDVPAGPGGIRPELALTYSSGATDGRSGRRPKTQSSWVGKGWSLDTGSIAMYKTRVYSQERLRFALMLGGLAADLVRSDPLVANPSPTNPTHWEWRSANESFIRARVLDAGPPTSDRGGFQSGNPFPRYLWHVWTKDGTRYEFAEDLWWGWNDCVGGEGDYAYMETYRWRLSRTVDTHGNVANAIPGLTETSLLPQAAEAAGIDFDALIERVLDLALARAPA